MLLLRGYDGSSVAELARVQSSGIHPPNSGEFGDVAALRDCALLLLDTGQG